MKGTLEGALVSRSELEEALEAMAPLASLSAGDLPLVVLFGREQRTGLSKVSVASLRPYFKSPSNHIALCPLFKDKPIGM